MSRRSTPLSYANVTATLALVFALGGSAYAATQLPENSVGRAQIRKNAITSAKVENGSLKLADFDRVALRKLRGPAGPQGPAGPTGASGVSDLVVRRADSGPLPAGVFTSVLARCSPGERAVGGGAGFDGNAGHEVVEQSYPAKQVGPNFLRAEDGEVADAWVTYIKNGNTVAFAHTYGYVVCARP